jgi:hypothetical protein
MQRFSWVASLIGALLWSVLLVSAGGWTLGEQSMWAFSFLAFLPLPLRLLLAAAVLLCWALVTYHELRITNYVLRITYYASHIAYPIWLLGAGLLFWLLREQTWHGDALLKVQLLGTQTLQSDPYVWKEPLDSLLSYTVTGWLAEVGQPPEVAVALLSVLAGMIYMAALLWASDLLGESPDRRVTYVIGLLALGSSQLWFGHVENYSLVTALSMVTVALAAGYLRQRVALGWVGLAAGCALGLHPQSAFILPALLLLLKRPRLWQQLVTLLCGGLIAPTVTVSVLWWMGSPWPNLANGYAGDPQLFWRLEQLLAPAQLRDALSNLWLLAPLTPLWLVAGCWAWSKPVLHQDRLWRYLSGVTAGLLVYHFAFQNDLPRPQDWDLFAIVGPAITLWGLYAWLHLFPAPGHPITLSPFPPFLLSQQLLWPALTFALLLTGAWVGVNHTLTLIRPNADSRAIYQRYRLQELTTLLPQATITPSEPICGEATGCERVALTDFTMPQDGDRRPTIFAHAPAQIAIPLQVPSERSFLWVSPALDPVAWGWGGDGVTFRVFVAHKGGEELLWARHLSANNPADLDWQEVLAPLDQFRGQMVTILLVTTPGPANNDTGDRAGWGLPWLMRGTPDRRFD